MLNKQIPIKSESGPELLVHSLFYTIQGEGPFAGECAVFVRLGGCNLACPKCDTEYTDGSIRMTPDVIAFEVQKHWQWGRPGHANRKPIPPLVVITGGEPFRQNIGPLVSLMIRLGWRVQIETNGTLFREDLPYGLGRLTIVCSPKAGKVNRHLEPHISAYKYVLAADGVDDSDGLPTSALGLPGRPARPLRPGTPIFVNPVDDKDPTVNIRNLEASARSCLKFGYRLGIQIHKLANLE